MRKAHPRRDEVLHRLSQSGAPSVAVLAEEVGVTKVTIYGWLQGARKRALLAATESLGGPQVTARKGRERSPSEKALRRLVWVPTLPIWREPLPCRGWTRTHSSRWRLVLTLPGWSPRRSLNPRLARFGFDWTSPAARPSLARNAALATAPFTTRSRGLGDTWISSSTKRFSQPEFPEWIAPNAA
jgi:transposase